MINLIEILWEMCQKPYVILENISLFLKGTYTYFKPYRYWTRYVSFPCVLLNFK